MIDDKLAIDNTVSCEDEGNHSNDVSDQPAPSGEPHSVAMNEEVRKTICLTLGCVNCHIRFVYISFLAASHLIDAETNVGLQKPESTIMRWPEEIPVAKIVIRKTR